MGKLLIVIGIVLFCCIAEWMKEIRTFRVTHYEIESKKLSGLQNERTVVFLTDLHDNCYEKNNQPLIDAVRAQKPELILIGGDMLIGQPHLKTDIAEEFVTALTQICPVYYANGNHEFRMKLDSEKYGNRYQQYKERLEQAGVLFLENEHVDVAWDQCKVQIHGLEIPREYYKKFKKLSMDPQVVSDAIGERDNEKYQVLLAHNPTYMQAYCEWGADLILAGHFHGGVVRLPMIGGVISPQFHLFPKYSGELTVEGDKSIVVSKGLGTHTFKVRFLNPAEIVVLHMKGKRK